MSYNPNFMTNSTKEGIERVRKGGYAYLLESTTNEYARQRDCNLMQVGGLLDSKGYGFGLQKNSKWTETISSAILKLQENGKILQLYNKWWKQIGAINCEEIMKPSDKGSSMDFSNVVGIFAILASGLLMSSVVTVIEVVWKRQKNFNLK
jgi:ionotropic glutamate receptor